MTKFFIDQHGCAKNQTDGELIIGYLTKNGFEFTTNPDEADFIIINSCGFIESAKKESIDAIYNIRKAYPNSKIVLTGCLAQRYASLFSESIPELDGIFGNGDLSKISEFMNSVKEDKKEDNKVITKTYPQEGICGGNRPVLYNFPGCAFVKITEGCSNHCSFCAIPLIRGELRSRGEKEIIEEIKELLNSGVYELNLIGQDLAAYGTEKGYTYDYDADPTLSPLANLMKEISKLEGDFKVRLLYIHPDHFNKDILDIIKKDNRFLHYFDIPFQTGDDRIIKLMNRTGSFDTYVSLINDIRKVLPDAAIRTTFLTGFPGEDNKAANNTKNFLETIKPDWSGCFPYSREEDTPSYNMRKRVSTKVAEKRANVLEEIQTKLTFDKLESKVGNEYDVLIEEIIENDEKVSEDVSEGLAIGRAWFQAPEVDGSVVVRYERDDEKENSAIKPGNIVRVKIIASTGVDLDGRFISLVKEFDNKYKKNFLL